MYHFFAGVGAFDMHPTEVSAFLMESEARQLYGRNRAVSVFVDAAGIITIVHPPYIPAEEILSSFDRACHDMLIALWGEEGG